MDNEFLDRAQLDQQEAAQNEKDRKKQEKKKAAANRKPSTFIQILNGDFLTKEFMLNNLNFIFFIIFLLLLTVAKGYYGKELTKKVNDKQSELEEARSDYFESKARLEEETGRKRLVEELRSTGLKETVNPTKVIRVKKENVE